MPAPLIGVTTSVTVDESPERAYVNASYLRAVEGAGGIPVLLPPHLSEQARRALWERLDGVLLTGGGDIDPARFNEPAHPAVAEVSTLRDALEIEVVERALDDGIPLLAICRGLQVLNVALGGTLYQDLLADKASHVAHRQKEPRDRATHAVKVMGEGTRLASIAGAPEIEVNSFHHQAIKRLAGRLKDVAWAPDGVIEAVEMEGDHFVLAVQWHPEDLVEHDPAARGLFAALTAAARR
ncbi:MAG TPA: gamma-glutamyl-gamma-aminobutyrate hydrolase family protein [Candidatus Limnocylindria bacterium]|nr:gamma-glutamyl-gamma-aminobutyrate hydrolase family protein [Candidatus Limnocylindria bacterium]